MGPKSEMVSQPPFLHLGIHIGESIVYICIHNGENFVPSNVQDTLLHWTPSLLTSVLVKPIQLYTKSNGKCLCAATHHFSACKPYGRKLRLYQPNQPLLIVTAQFVQYFVYLLASGTKKLFPMGSQSNNLISIGSQLKL